MVLEAPMAKQITVLLTAGPRQEVPSPALFEEQAEHDYAQIVAAQQAGGAELLTLPWISVRGGMILAVQVEDVADPSLPRVASWK
jgi:hypothetical protein